MRARLSKRRRHAWALLPTCISVVGWIALRPALFVPDESLEAYADSMRWSSDTPRGPPFDVGRRSNSASVSIRP